jgi:UDP-glucose 4-epimerase
VSRRILVTGGAGFIGSHLVERLIAEGAEVHVLDDLSRGRRGWLPESTALHRIDICDGDAVVRVAAEVKPNVVAHLAAMHFIPAVDGAPDLARAVNVNGTERLLAALAPRPPERLLFASSAAVYPDRSGPISELCPPVPIDVYGETKLAGEQLVARFAADTRVSCVVARLFNVVGRRETNPHVVPEIIEQVRSGATQLRLGRLDTRRDYTDVVDVAAALAQLLEPSVRGGVFNVGSGRATSVRDLVDLCERIVARRFEVIADSSRLRRVDRMELRADVSALREATGWAPTRSLAATLSDLLGANELSRS